jgi:hypothetical protein
MEGGPRQFGSPQEEITYLRQQIAERERELLDRTPEIDHTDIETVGRQEMQKYASFAPKMVLHKDYQLSPEELISSVEGISVAQNQAEEILHIAAEKGIKNALSILEKTGNAFITDEVHRKLIEQIKGGYQMGDLREGVPPWQVLHMTLFEIALPAEKEKHESQEQLAKLVGMMQQLLLGMRNASSEKENRHFAVEVAVDNQSHDIIYYVAVPNEYVSLFEKQALSIFPDAVLTIQPHDYNIFTDGGSIAASEAKLLKHPIYPLKMHEEFATDPLLVVLNAFSKIEREGEGAALQFTIRYPKVGYRREYESVIKNIETGMKTNDAIARSTFVGEFTGAVFDVLKTTARKEMEEKEVKTQVDEKAVEQFREKIKTDIIDVNMRLLVSARDSMRANQLLGDIESAFHQFSNVEGNTIIFKPVTNSGGLKRIEKAFSFRDFNKGTAMQLSVDELSTLIHFPEHGGIAAPQFKQSHALTAAAPTSVPYAGTLLGKNIHRNVERDIYITDEDRLRHFYIIGQTGTGKTTLMKNMIVQDIMRGYGVCMIDPHGTDIDDVLGAVPPEREQDVIYFDPSYTDRVVGLNMLEYDYSKPEQKTFVVNELFSIFQKLYGANPESMGPMFEQYFRNATLLVMEDPESGNTLMDISRVMSDARYRREKLAKATNPVVVQFWREIATKAGGEASLENIVPYIVSKFDVFTANDYMRPIIGQQRSAFNFRNVMDERKILLVNLAKGRIGEINANLIGMIFVGKILMAALSRVDDPTKSFAPFYLHMDEFQNVSTNSISAILSEARKYKLGLTIAHQFIAQLQPEIKDAVFGNVGSLAAFRVGPDDAQFLEHQFSPVFTAGDLMNIPNRNAYVRVLANGSPTPPFSLATNAPTEPDFSRINQLKEQSYSRHGRDRVTIEQEIHERYQKPVPPVPPMPAFPQL